MKTIMFVYRLWLVALVYLAIIWKARVYSGTSYFILNMVVSCGTNIVITCYLIKLTKKYDCKNYERIKKILLTRTNLKELSSTNPFVQQELEKYFSFFPYSVADVVIVIAAEIFINLV